MKEQGRAAIRVVVVDRNRDFRDTLRRVLRDYRECDVLAETPSVKDAIRLMRKARVSADLVLLDFLALLSEKPARLRQLAEDFPETRVVVLLNEFLPEYREAVAGRWGYLCVAKEKVEEHVGWVLDDLKPLLV